MNNSLYLLQKPNQLLLPTHKSYENHFWVFFIIKIYIDFSFIKLNFCIKVLFTVHCFAIKFYFIVFF